MIEKSVMKKIVKMFLTASILVFPMSVYAKEFLSSFMHINLGYMFSLKPYSGFVKEEEKYYLPVTSSSGKTSNVRPKHSHNGLSFGIDLMPFDSIAVGGDYRRVFKIGIRGVGRYNVINQELREETGKNSYEDHGGQLVSYFDFMVGPVLRYSPFSEINMFDGRLGSRGGFTFYTLVGRVFNGELTAFPAKRNNPDEEFTGDYSTSVSGWRFDVGIGGEFGICNVNVGLNVFYSYTGFEMKDEIYPNTGRTSHMNEMCFEIYMGMPIDLI